VQAIAYRGWSIGEMLLLFVAGPAVLARLVYDQHIPLLVILPVVFGGLMTLLFRQSDQTWRSDLLRLPAWRDVFSILALFALCGGALTIFAYERYPQSFLSFLRSNTTLWLFVMVFYPLISVTTQELVYRVFFFHRYAPALNGSGGLAIAVNAMLFATMHAILFASRGSTFHWEAVAFSLIGGLIFAYRFVKTRSLLAVWLEHALYGDLIFTIGLGRFFFTGVANL
jgi:CAAX protease family protein